MADLPTLEYVIWRECHNAAFAPIAKVHSWPGIKNTGILALPTFLALLACHMGIFLSLRVGSVGSTAVTARQR